MDTGHTTMILYFDTADWIVFLALFAMGAVYWVALDLWLKYWPDSYEELVWFQVVIGVFYVLFGVAFIIEDRAWIKVTIAFIFSSILIIIRSISITARNRREAIRREREEK